jgi:hypothetical protein
VYFSVIVLNKEKERDMSLETDGIKSNRTEFTVDLIFSGGLCKESFWEIVHRIYESEMNVTELEDSSPSMSIKYSNTNTLVLRHYQ